MKRFLYYALGFFLLIVLGLSAYLFFFGQQHLQQFAERKLSTLLERPLQISGPLDFDIGKRVVLRVPKVSLPEQSQPLVSAELERFELSIPVFYDSLNEVIVQAQKLSLVLSTAQQASSAQSKEPANSSAINLCVAVPALPQVRLHELSLLVRSEETQEPIRLEASKLDLRSGAKIEDARAIFSSTATYHNTPLEVQSKIFTKNDQLHFASLNLGNKSSSLEAEASLREDCTPVLKVALRSDSLEHLRPFVPTELGATGPFSLSGELAVSADSFSVDNLRLELAQTEASGSVTKRNGQYVVELQASGDSLASINALYPLKLPALGPFQLDATYTSMEEGFALELEKAVIAESDVSGSLRYSPKEISGDLRSSRFRVADVQPAKEADDRKAEVAEVKRDPMSEELQVAAIPEQTINLSYAAEVFEVHPDFALQDLDLALNGQNRDLQLEIKKASADAQQLSGTVDLLASAEMPKMRGDLEARDLALAQLLGDPEGFDLPSTAHLKLEAVGKTPRAMLEQLDGRVEVATRSGTADLSSLALVLRGLSDLLSPLIGRSSRDNNIHCLVAAINFADGVGTFEPLILHAAKVAFIGSGTIRPAASTMDLRVSMRSDEPTLSSMLTPFRVSGPFSKLSAAPDVVQTGKELLNAPLSVASLASRSALATAGSLIGIDEKDTSLCKAAFKKLALIQTSGTIDPADPASPQAEETTSAAQELADEKPTDARANENTLGETRETAKGEP